MKESYGDLALGFKRLYEQTISEIKTFEHIFKNKELSQSIRNGYKDLLKILYKERDENAKRAEHYRTLYKTPEKCKRSIGWGKDRT